jgi:ABC-2 type transport system ATP-binding protein
VIEICDLTKRYGATVAVDALTFHVAPGKVTGFLGPNGSGKSTTMRVILGLDLPDAGAARVCGRPYRTMIHPLRRVGALLDANAVHRGRPARDHLAALAASNKIPRSRVGAVLEQVGLTDAAHQRVGAFSFGMKQRLGIAAALLGDPEVLLFDEPINGLDPDGVLWMRTLLKSLARQGRTVFVSSHLMSEMALTADHLVIIGRGRLIADLGTAEFIAEHTGGEVMARSPRATELARLLHQHGATVETDGSDMLTVTGLDTGRIGDLATSAGLPVHELSARPVSLEDAYMQLTRDSTQFRSRPIDAPVPASPPRRDT